LAVSTLEIVTLLSVLGLPTAIPRFIGYYSGLNNQLKVKSTIFNVLKLNIPLSIIVSVLLYNFSNVIANSIFQKPQLSNILRIFAIVLPFMSMKLVFQAILNGFKESLYYIYSNTTLFIFLPIVFLTLSHFGLKLKAAYISYTISYFLSFAISFFLTLKIYIKQNFPNKKPPSILKELFFYSWPLIFHQMVWFLMVRVDTLMLGFYKSTSSVGVYNAAIPMGKFITLFLNSFGLLFLPVISEIYSKGDLDNVRSLYSITLKWITTLTIPIFLFLTFCAAENVHIFFGQQYADAAPALIIISIGYFIDSIFGLQSWILSASGKTKLLFMNSSVGLLLNFFLNFLLIPRYEIIGAAMATTTTLLFFNMCGVYQIKKYFKIKTYKFKNLTIFLIGLIAIILAKFTISLIVDLFTITGLAGCFLLFLIFYIIGLLFIRIFSKEDKIIILVIENKTGLNLKFLERFIH